MKLTTFNCPECGAPLEPIEDAMFMYCKYCGAKIMMDDIEFYKENAKTQRERIRTDAEVRKEEVRRKSELNMAQEKYELVGVVLMCILVVILAFVCLVMYCN